MSGGSAREVAAVAVVVVVAAVAAAEKERENQCKCRRNATAEERVTEKLIVAKIFELEQVGFHQRYKSNI